MTDLSVIFFLRAIILFINSVLVIRRPSFGNKENSNI